MPPKKFLMSKRNPKFTDDVFRNTIIDLIAKGFLSKLDDNTEFYQVWNAIWKTKRQYIIDTSRWHKTNGDLLLCATEILDE